MMPYRSLLAAGFAAASSLVLTFAQTGVPDPAFQPGYAGSVLRLLVDGSGRAVVANEASFNPVVPLVDRILPDGRRDVTFQATFSVSYIRALALCPDGRILVSHDRTDQDPPLACALWRLKADGSVDPSFQPCGSVPQYVEAVLVQADGRIVVGGWTRYGMLDTPALVRLHEDGTRDPSFQAELPYSVNLLTRQPDGRILAAGALSQTGNSSDAHLRLVRLLPDGRVDGSFTPAFEDHWGWATALVLQPDGRMLLGAVIREPRGPYFDYESRLVRLEADGRLDAGFEAARHASGPNVAVQGGGRIVIGSTNHLYRLESDGQLDATFSVDSDPESLRIGPGWVQALNLLGDGSIMIGGSFQSYLGITNGSILRLRNDAGSGAGRLQWTASTVATSESANTLTLQIARHDGNRGEITVNYATHGGSAQPGQRYEPASGVIRFADGESGPQTVDIQLLNNAVGEGDQTFLVSLANPVGGATLGSPAETEITLIDDDTSLRFRWPTLAVREEDGSVDVEIERGGLLGGASSVQVQAVAGTARPGEDFQAAPARVEFAPGQSLAVYRITLLDNAWIQADRTFTVSLSDATGAVIEPRDLVVTIVDGDGPGRVDPLFDPSRAGWPANLEIDPGSLMPDAEGSVIAAAMLDQGPLRLTGLLRFRADGSVDPTFGMGREGVPVPSADSLTRMARLSSGRLLAVKGAAEVVAVSATGDLEPALARDLWTGWVNTMLASPGDQVLLQGELYRRDNDQERFAMVRLNLDGSRDESFRSPVFGQFPDDISPTSVSTMAWAGDGTALVGGFFSRVDGQPRTGVVKLLADGRLDPAFVVQLERAVPGTSLPAEVMRVAVQTDGRIYLAGEFTSVQGVPRWGLARLLPDGSLDATFDPGTGFSVVYPRFPTSFWTIACLQPTENGRLLVGGWFERVQGERANRLVRLNADGTLDRTFATFTLPVYDPWNTTGPLEAVFSMAPALDGRVWIAGNFTSYDGLPRPGLARINNGSVLQLGAVKVGAGGTLTLDLWLPAPGRYELEASGDLRTWAKIDERNFTASGAATWTVTPDADPGALFCRVRLP